MPKPEIYPPILFIIYNRPEPTRIVFERIRSLRPSILFIAADGPRENIMIDSVKCAEVRELVSDIDWKCEIHTLFRDHNLGCKMAVSSAIDWFFEHVEQGIILEDDCLPEPAFFTYCYELLERFKHDPKILSINGFNFGYEPETPLSYSFTSYMNMWGWATWRRSAYLIDYNLNDWGKKNKSLFLFTRLRSSLFDFDWKWVKWWRNKFDEVKEKKIDTWDYQWLYAGFKYRLYSIVPHHNLIRNIGFNGNATHTTNSEHPISRLETRSLNLPLTHPGKIVRNGIYEEQYVKKIWKLYFRRNILYQLQTFYGDIIPSRR